jgi:hypothetical protein
MGDKFFMITGGYPYPNHPKRLTAVNLVREYLESLKSELGIDSQVRSDGKSMVTLNNVKANEYFWMGIHLVEIPGAPEPTVHISAVVSSPHEEKVFADLHLVARRIQAFLVERSMRNPTPVQIQRSRERFRYLEQIINSLG